jgi:hypothetical protein
MARSLSDHDRILLAEYSHAARCNGIKDLDELNEESKDRIPLEFYRAIQNVIDGKGEQDVKKEFFAVLLINKDNDYYTAYYNAALDILNGEQIK